MDPLMDLRDIHLPDAVSLWPLALGWWILIFVLIAIGLLVFLGYRRYQAQAARRLAKQAIKQAESPQQILVVLKSLCLSYFPREQVAGLYGEAWQQFLVQQLKLRHQVRFQQLSTGLFAQVHTAVLPPEFSNQLKDSASFWIQHANLTAVNREPQS